MSKYNREWLRSFLNLSAEASREGIFEQEIRRQEDTILHALTLLDEEPGVILADEVGMGKTFEALGLMACFRHRVKAARILVITPGPDLNAQWMQSSTRFRENGFYAFGESDFAEVYRLADLSQAVSNHPVVFVPINVFLGGRAQEEQDFLIAAFMRWSRLREESRKQIAWHWYGSRREVPDVQGRLYLGQYTYEDFRNLGEEVLARAFKSAPDEKERDDLPEQVPGLHDLYENGPEAFKNEKAIKQALARARFHLLNAVLPSFDLLVVDEAHKLKNPWSLRTQAVSNIFFRKYRKTVFLTATPFQLGVYELEQIFRTFSYALKAPRRLMEDVKGLFNDIYIYQHAYRRFEEDWQRTDPADIEVFNRRYEEDLTFTAEIREAGVRRLLEDVRELRRLKAERIEPAFRRWMIRSIKEEKLTYRQALRRDITPEAGARIPFLLYERLLTELYRQGQSTYKAAVEINIASSFEAALSGALMRSGEGTGSPGVDEYRRLLRAVLEKDSSHADSHPKLQAVANDAYLAALKGEKTLIFSERVETIIALRKAIAARWRDDLLARWRRLFPGAQEKEILGDGGRHALYQTRFHRAQDTLYLALRENYLHTLVDLPAGLLERSPELLARANELLSEVRTGHTSAERVDYRLAKRCVEKAVVELLVRAQPRLSREGPVAAVVSNVLDERYVQHGLDLHLDEEEGDSIGSEQPQWTITERTLEHVLPLERRGIWWGLRERTARLDPQTRVRLAEAVATFLTRVEVAFIPDLLLQVQQRGGDLQSSESLRSVLEQWWYEPQNVWRARLEEFVGAFVDLNRSWQKEVLEDALKTGQFVRDTLDGEVRDRLKHAFNTPFYPMVLVANQVMQEGVDLHRHCRRVVHHDLSWNPAQLEQRVGRVDRLGSLVRRRRAVDGRTMLEMHFPLIERSIDIHQYRTVREREKWLDILLGVPPPEFDDHDPLRPPPPPLPDLLVKDLIIQLRPPPAPEASSASAAPA